MPEKQKKADNTDNTIITIPQFMSANDEQMSSDTDDISKSTGNIYKLMLTISSIWFLIVIIYITQFFGWSNLFLMMPDEFGGFLAGITLPLAVIWMVIAYIDRGTNFKQEAKLLHTYINQLIYPEDGAAQTTKAMADAIREQVTELQEATKKATNETTKIKNELSKHVTDFSKLVEILQGYSGTTMNELNEGIRLMSKGLDYINDKLGTATTDIESRMERLSSAANDITGDMNSVMSSLNHQIETIQEKTSELNTLYNSNSKIVTMNTELVNNCSTKLNDNFETITNFISAQNNRLEQVSNQISSNYHDMYTELQNKSAAVEQSFSGKVKQIADYMKNLDKTSLLAAEKFDDFRSRMNKEVDTIMTRANSIAECVELQVQNLTGIAKNINKDIDKAEQNIDSKISLLQQTSETAVNELDKASENVNNKINSLHQIQINAVESAKALCNELDEHKANFSASVQTAQTAAHQLCSQIVADVSSVKSSSDGLLDCLTATENAINRQAANIKNISETLDTQNRLNTVSIEQQYKLLDTALSKIENSKDVLRQQMEELLHMANTIDDETASSMKNMEASLTENLKKSAEIADNTTALTGQLQTQAQTFELISDQTIAKVSDFGVQIKEQQGSLDTLIQNVVTRAERVASLLEAQVKAVNSATDNTTNKHNKLIELFNQQSSVLNNTAESTTQYVADMIQALDEKAEMINLLFKNQQTEFFTICDKLADNTGNISQTLKNQISLLEQGSDRVFSRMTGFEEEFSKKAELLTNTSNQTMDKLIGITDVLNRQNEEIEKSVANINTKMQAVGNEVNKYITSFNESLQAVKDGSSAAGNEIADSCSKLKDSQRSLLTDSHNVSQMIENQIKSLDGSLSKIQNQSEQISSNLNKQKDSIADVINLVSTQTRLGEASLAQQYKYLSDAATDVNNKMKEIQASFKNNTAGIFEESNKLAFEINTLSDKLIKAGEDVQKTTKQSIGDLESVSMSLSNTADGLIDTVNNTNQKVAGVISNYQTHIANFNTVTAETSSGIVEVNNMISQQNDKMIKISEDTRNLVNNFNVVLNEASNQMTKRANGAYEQIKAMSAQMKDLSLQLENSTQVTAKHIENAGAKMRANITEIAANAERISNDIRSSGEVFLKQSDVLTHTSADTLEKVNKAMEAIKNGTDTLTIKGKMWLEQSEEFTKVFEKQSEIIDTTSLKANENLRKLESKYQEVQTDTFLKDAAVLFERMETVAIDINRIFNPTTEEEIWKKYYSGDTAAFVRYLAKVMTKNQINAIRKEYEKNADFRSLVNRYVADFEMLITKAKGNERAGVLLSVISGSDVGKVYYVIAKALDKLN